jgi:hypothetical protein
MADRANNPGGFSHAAFAGVLAVAALCAACTSDVTGYSVVTQDKYAIMNCPDIVKQRTALAAQEKNLSSLVEKAEAAPGGFIAGTLAYRSELGETRMKLRLAEQAAAQKNCDAPQK